MEGNTVLLTENLIKLLAIVIFTGIICVKLSRQVI